MEAKFCKNPIVSVVSKVVSPLFEQKHFEAVLFASKRVTFGSRFHFWKFSLQKMEAAGMWASMFESDDDDDDDTLESTAVRLKRMIVRRIELRRQGAGKAGPRLRRPPTDPWACTWGKMLTEQRHQLLGPTSAEARLFRRAGRAGPRLRRPRTDPWACTWGKMLSEQRVQLEDPDSAESTTFRLRFRVPFPLFFS